MLSFSCRTDSSEARSSMTSSTTNCSRSRPSNRINWTLKLACSLTTVGAYTNKFDTRQGSSSSVKTSWNTKWWACSATTSTKTLSHCRKRMTICATWCTKSCLLRMPLAIKRRMGRIKCTSSSGCSSSSFWDLKSRTSVNRWWATITLLPWPRRLRWRSSFKTCSLMAANVPWLASLSQRRKIELS